MRMQALFVLIILAFICTASGLYANELQSLRTAIRSSKIPDSTESKCGISAKTPERGRIVGGVEANPHAWPWQVHIQCQRFFAVATCGGSIISDKWVITAAHCLIPTAFDIRRDCKVMIGKHDLRRIESTEQIANIADYFIHAKYDPDERHNAYDLALCNLANPLNFTEAIKPICLPFGLPELSYNTSCYATGWGVTKSGTRIMSDRLMQLSMSVTNESNCFYPTRSIICTARWDRSSDVCDGDSGGPLVCQERDRKWHLRGVLSQASKECDFGAIYTKVASFEKWIKNITSRN